MIRMISVLMLGGFSAFAQGDVQIYRGSVVTAAELVAGRIVLIPDAVVFLDDANPHNSFFSTKANVKSVSPEGETVTIQLENSVRDRVGETTRLIFRLSAPADAMALQNWHGGVASQPAAGSSEAGSQAEMTFSAQKKKRFRSNTDGKLIIDNTRLMFESTDNASDSRRWDLKDIKELKYKNAYELEIRPFRGEKYVLMLSGAGMDDAQYREIVDRVTKARTAR